MFVKIDPPPGVYKNGTEYESAGRFYDASLFRWHQGWKGPIGGWRQRSPSAVTGKGRAAITWKTNENASWIAVGTDSHLYVLSQGGTLSDITPAGYMPGRPDAVTGGGFGAGLFGGRDIRHAACRSDAGAGRNGLDPRY